MYFLRKKQIYKEHISCRKKPKNYEEKFSIVFLHEFSKKINASYILELKYAILLNDVIFSPFRFQFFPSYSKKTKQSISSLLYRLKFLLNPGNKISKAVWIKDDWSNNYFHWFTDALPRLMLDETITNDFLVLIPEWFRNYPYIVDSLEILGFKAHYYNSNSSVFINRLMVPSHTAPSENYNKDVILKIRSCFLPDSLPENPTKRIYISRKNANHRKIINETEIINLLKEYEYEIHYFENYSLTDQINLAYNTEFLISIHGAGLTNMLFMPANSKVLEIRNENNTHDNCFYTLASELNLDYYYLPVEQYSYKESNILADIQDVYVSKERLIKVLKCMHNL